MQTARYRAVPSKIDRRRSIEGEIDHRRSIEEEKGKKKEEKKKKEEEKKDRVVTARAHGRFFSHERRQNISPREEKDRGDLRRFCHLLGHGRRRTQGEGFAFAGRGEREEGSALGRYLGRDRYKKGTEGPVAQCPWGRQPIGPRLYRAPQPSDERIRFLGRTYERRVACAERGAFATVVLLYCRQRGGECGIHVLVTSCVSLVPRFHWSKSLPRCFMWSIHILESRTCSHPLRQQAPVTCLAQPREHNF
ncbi:hypothetical protein BHM03_00020713 [Ensete ventricosum]|nr:hypothetical protein BHM03_00020713 [Ensete ventricosum]